MTGWVAACGMPPERPTPRGAASWHVAPTAPLPIVAVVSIHTMTRTSSTGCERGQAI